VAHIDVLPSDDLTAWLAFAVEEKNPQRLARIFEDEWGNENVARLTRAHGRVQREIGVACARAVREIKDYRFDKLDVQRADLAVDQALDAGYGARRQEPVWNLELVREGTTSADIRHIFKAAVWSRLQRAEGGASTEARRQANSSPLPKRDPEEIGYVAMAWCDERRLDWLAMNESPPKGEARKHRPELWAYLTDKSFYSREIAEHWNVTRQAVEKSLKLWSEKVATAKENTDEGNQDMSVIATDEQLAQDAEELVRIETRFAKDLFEIRDIAQRLRDRFPTSDEISEAVDALLRETE
jgi:hypothetical protein